MNAAIRGSAKNPDKAKHLLSLPGAAVRLKVFDGGDLEVQGSFDSSFAGADAVIHTAAEVALGEEESIITASVEGTKNVLSSVDKSKSVKRFVQTSSVAAIQKYNVPPNHVFSEEDWNDWSSVEKGDAYGVAKTRAERLVHDHFKGSSSRFSISLNPGVVIGPVMTKAHTKASAVFLRELIFGNKAMVFPSTYVDVRDVAAGHVNALERLPDLGGQRFILVNDTKCMPRGVLDLKAVANKVLPEYKFDVQPNIPEPLMFFVRPLSRLPIVGRKLMTEYQRVAESTPVNFTNKKARSVLGVDFRPLDVTVKEGIESIVGLGFAKLKKR